MAVFRTTTRSEMERPKAQGAHAMGAPRACFAERPAGAFCWCNKARCLCRALLMRGRASKGELWELIWIATHRRVHRL
jgi:hypothetical protein